MIFSSSTHFSSGVRSALTSLIPACSAIFSAAALLSPERTVMRSISRAFTASRLSGLSSSARVMLPIFSPFLITVTLPFSPFSTETSSPPIFAEMPFPASSTLSEMSEPSIFSPYALTIAFAMGWVERLSA